MSDVSNIARAIDWEAIEREYRAGLLSVRELGRRYTVSHQAINERAEREGWERDLTARVRQAVSARLAANPVAGSSTDEKATIEAAAVVGANVIRLHRHDVGRVRALAGKLMDRLEAALNNADAMEDLIAQEPDGLARLHLRRAVALPEHAKTLDKITTTLAKIIPLERQAYDLDDKPPDPAGAQDRHKLQTDAYTAVLSLLADKARNAHTVIEGDFSSLPESDPKG